MAESDRDNHIPVEDLSAYADDAFLSAGERARIEQHLATCEECRDELESLRAVSMLLGELPEPEVPRSFRLSPEDAASVRTEAGAEPEPVQPWILRYQAAFRYAGLAAALLLVVILTVDFLPEDDSDDDFAIMEEPAADVSDDESEDGDMSITGDEDSAESDADQEVMEEDADDEEASEPERDQDAMDEDDVAEEEASEPEGDQDVMDQDEAADEEAPEEQQDTAADEPDSDADDPADDDVADESDDEVDEPVATQDAGEPDDAAADTTSTPEPSDGELSEMQDADERDNDGLSTLQTLSIGLGILSATLLTLGFVVPRWWHASASYSDRT